MLDSDDRFKAYGVSLFSIAISRMFGGYNFLAVNKVYINYLTNLIANKNYRVTNDEGIEIEYDFGWQHEVYVEVAHDFVYIEKWGICTRIMTEELLGIFQEIESFLNRWKSKEMLMAQVKNAFALEAQKKSEKNYFIKIESGIDKDQIWIMLNEDDFEMDANEFVQEIKFPMHMI